MHITTVTGAGGGRTNAADPNNSNKIVPTSQQQMDRQQQTTAVVVHTQQTQSLNQTVYVLSRQLLRQNRETWADHPKSAENPHPHVLTSDKRDNIHGVPLAETSLTWCNRQTVKTMIRQDNTSVSGSNAGRVAV